MNRPLAMDLVIDLCWSPPRLPHLSLPLRLGLQRPYHVFIFWMSFDLGGSERLRLRVLTVRADRSPEESLRLVHCGVLCQKVVRDVEHQHYAPSSGMIESRR